MRWVITGGYINFGEDGDAVIATTEITPLVASGEHLEAALRTMLQTLLDEGTAGGGTILPPISIEAQGGPGWELAMATPLPNGGQAEATVKVANRGEIVSALVTEVVTEGTIIHVGSATEAVATAYHVSDDDFTGGE